MSTHALTVFVDGDADGKTIATLYRHCDGYPSEHGRELLEALKGRAVRNGIRGDGRWTYNGAGDLAVRVICALKAMQGAHADKTKALLAKAGVAAVAKAAAKENEDTVDAEVWNREGNFYLCAEDGPANCDYYYTITAAADQPIHLRLTTSEPRVAVLYDGPINDFDPVAVENAEAEGA